MVAIKTFINVRKSADLASGVLQAWVGIFFTPANRYESETAKIAERVTMAIANNFIDPNLPIKIFMREGCLTNKLRKVPYVYSCAV